MTDEQETNHAVARSRSTGVLERNRYLFFISGDHWALCPYCRGLGLLPTASTTYSETCWNCCGSGKVRVI